MKIIVGLGNPGDKYINTRHNLGFRVVDKLGISSKDQVLWEKSDKFQAVVCRLKAVDLTLVKPQTYMNNSGEAVKKLADFYKVAIEDIIVIHDELDLPLGKIRINQGGSAAGHHGVESVINCLGSDQFIRVRLGIRVDQEDKEKYNKVVLPTDQFVLEEFTKGEEEKVVQIIDQATKAVQVLLTEGLEKTQNKFHYG